MVSKKGYIKTLEAAIAIILIIVVSYALIVKNIEKTPETPLVVKDSIKFISEKIEFNESIRKDIINRNSNLVTEDILESVIRDDKPRDYDFVCLICSGTTACLPPDIPIEKNIYVGDVFIASSEKETNPHVVRVWFWKSPTKDVSTEWLNECAFD